MQLKKGEILELDISDLAFGGAGVGKIALGGGGNDSESGKNFVVFVDGAVSGDRVRVSLTKIKKQYAEARLEEILKPSPTRITPRCKHFAQCGGCSLQFLSYEDQLKWKERVIRDTLAKIGGFDSEFLEKISSPVIGCASPWFYRNKMEYSFGGTGGDTSKDGNANAGSDRELMLGLHPQKKWRDVFDVEECFLQSEQSVKIMSGMREWAKKKGLSVFDNRTQKGLLRNLVVREGKNTGELMVNLIINGEDFSFAQEFTEWIISAFPKITSLYHTAVKIQRGYKTVIKEFHLAGKKTLTEKLRIANSGSALNDGALDGCDLELSFEILPQAFFQPNTIQAQVLYGKILEFAEPDKHKIILDLFCGTGTIGMFCAASGANVIGIDLSESAIENACENAKSNSIANIDFRCRDVGKALAELKPAETANALVITDPPRSGITDKSLEKIQAVKPKRWIYVSCNPATLARDLKIICAAGYSLKRVQPVDMFPHTYHVETICLLEHS